MYTDSLIPEDMSLLIIDYLKGVISNEGLSRLKVWLLEDERHLEQFNLMKSAWILSGNSISYSPLKIEEDLEKVKLKLRVDKVARKVSFWTISKIAASWIIMLTVGTLAGMFLKQNTIERSSVTTITAPLGSKSVVDLPDGSKVWINAGSKITYNNKFGKTTREVNLIGEAYFSVKTNKEIPFIVKTSDIVVKAVGTRFNVKAYPNEKIITTTLEEGKILVTSLNGKSKIKSTELKPKQMLTYLIKEKNKKENKEHISASDPNKELLKGKRLTIDANLYSEIKTELVTSWKDNTWIIEGQPLGFLAPMLERRYNIMIKFGSEEIKQYKFTGKIQNETVEQIMTALELSAPIKYQIQNNIIELNLNNKLLEKYSKNTN